MSPAVTMWKTNLRSSLKTILGQTKFRFCTKFSHSWSDVASDLWPTHKHDRVLRGACLMTGLQACRREIAPSQRAQGRERILVVPQLFALPIGWDHRCGFPGFEGG